MNEFFDDDWGSATLGVRAAEPRTGNREHSAAISMTSSYVFESAAQAAAVFSGSEPGYIYSRFSNPTTEAFERRLAAMEGGASCVATASGMAALVSSNPHNQTLAVGIQLGLLGAVVLFAMWLAHAVLFWRAGFAAWVGLAIVAENLVGSLFNSHLFDFTHGWGYVIGVGVAGGMVLRQEAAKQDAQSLID